MSSSDAGEFQLPNPLVAARYAGRELAVEEILEILPHRPPFLLVDRVIELEPGLSGTGIKCVTINEPFFVGHYPGHPVMPGVLIIEALAQVGGVVILTGVELGGRHPYFTGIESAKFRQPVRPGDQLRLEVELTKHRMRFGHLICWMSAKAKVDGQVAAETNCTFAFVQAD